jgi:hypothetical protein
MYTYRPPFLLTLLHPSHNFLTELRTFMPRACCASCSRSPLKRDVRSWRGCGCWRAARRVGRRRVLHPQVGVWMWRARRARREEGNTVRRSGNRRERESILAGRGRGVVRVMLEKWSDVVWWSSMGIICQECTCSFRPLSHRTTAPSMMYLHVLLVTTFVFLGISCIYRSTAYSQHRQNEHSSTSARSSLVSAMVLA